MKLSKIILILTLLISFSCQDKKYTTEPEVSNPDKPNSPTPRNGNTGIELEIYLSWKCNNAEKYDIYFGINNPPTTLFADNITSNSVNRTGLSYKTTYYWKVVAKSNNETKTESEIWNFTTKDELKKIYITDHFNIHYQADSTIAYQIYNYAEEVYDFVDSIYFNTAPESRTSVYLSGERLNYYSFGGSKPEGIYLYLYNGTSMKEIFAHEVGHVAFWHITDRKIYKYDFINEGISVLIELQYEMELGTPEPWEKRAYWAAHSNKIKKNELSDWNEKETDLGNIFYGVGYTFVKFFRDQHGVEKWINFIKALSYTSDLTNAFQEVDLNYNDFYDQWFAFLLDGYYTYQNTLSKVPVIKDSLIIESTEDLKDVKVKIVIQNNESSSYAVYLSYYINTYHQEINFSSNSSKFEKIATIGKNLPLGTKIRYNVVVVSDILKTWIKSGWKKYTVY